MGKQWRVAQELGMNRKEQKACTFSMKSTDFVVPSQWCHWGGEGYLTYWQKFPFL